MSKIPEQRNSLGPDGAPSAAETAPGGQSDAAARRAAWMSALALADPDLLARLWRETGLAPEHQTLRGPEFGLVMTRGRAGAQGEAFNLGEATATRCSVRLRPDADAAADAVDGHAYVLGRAPEKARIAALCDALLQTEAEAQISAAILAPLAKARADEIARARAEAAATRVEFFTMTRGEDE